MKRNMDRTQGATSVSSKRKMTRPKLSPQAIEGVKNLEREDDSCGMGPSNIDETNFQRIKRTCTKKRYHDLQPVAAKPTEETPSVSSYCSVITSNLFNGLESQRIRRMGPSGSATLQCKESEFALKQKRLDEVEASSLKQYIEEVKKTVPVIVPVAQFTRRNLRTDSAPEPKLPLNTKKETPVYPPGSQEEKWQLQIFAKGRVNCPKCKSVGRKTVDGLKKHMESCKLNAFKCPHCEKQLKTSTGMKYHLMADHNNLPILDPGNDEFDQFAKEKLRKVLKRLGKLKCSKEGCTGSFTSIMGYVYHMKKCGKEESELEKLLLSCKHCAKPYRSRAGLVYHLKNEHGITLQKSVRDDVKTQKETVPERSQSGRAKRLSAQVATFHLREIASQERHKEWPKKKVQHDLVPDDRKLKYSRPGLPSFSQEILRKWKNQVKLRKKVPCPNKGCGCFYTSVSGLKAHIGLCTMGEFESGKYRCLICKKEFNSESGVKYHINSVHSQDWFVVKTKSKKCDKLHKPHQKPDSAKHSENPSPAPDLAHTPWQDRQTLSGSSEKNRKDEPDRRKQKGNEDKVCYASLS